MDELIKLPDPNGVEFFTRMSNIGLIHNCVESPMFKDEQYRAIYAVSGMPIVSTPYYNIKPPQHFKKALCWFDPEQEFKHYVRPLEYGRAYSCWYNPKCVKGFAVDHNRYVMWEDNKLHPIQLFFDCNQIGIVGDPNTFTL